MGGEGCPSVQRGARSSVLISNSSVRPDNWSPTIHAVAVTDIHRPSPPFTADVEPALLPVGLFIRARVRLFRQRAVSRSTDGGQREANPFHVSDVYRPRTSVFRPITDRAILLSEHVCSKTVRARFSVPFGKYRGFFISTPRSSL